MVKWPTKDLDNGDCVIGGGEGRGGNRRTGNYGTSASSSSHVKSSWRLKEFTEEVVTIGVGSLLQYFTTRVEKVDFLRRR